MRQFPHNEAKLAALLADGRIIDVALKNFGWDERSKSYVTQFEFLDMAVVSHFRSPFYEQQFCSEPNVRFCKDYADLEAAIEQNCGSTLDDLEEA